MFEGLDCAQVSAAHAVDLLRDVDREIARLHAVQADLIVAAASPETEELEVWVRDDMTEQERRIMIEDPIRDELATALHRSSLAMQRMIDTARWLAGPLRPTWQALHDGRITMGHVRILEEAARDLPEELLLEFQAKVLPRACERTLANTRRAVRETVHRLDEEGCVRRRRTAVCSRDVAVMHESDGVSVIWARLRTEQALSVMRYVDGHARARAEDADPDSELLMGEHRADALTALVLGKGSPILRAHVNVTIPLDTLLGLQDGTAELEGMGAVTADVVRDLLADPDCELTMRRMVTDPLTGHLLDLGRNTYAIPRAMRDFISTRDRTCRFPGCNRRADLCEIDHAVAWDDGGETTTANLGALCKRHHQLKTHAGWDITESRPDGSCVWRSPQGRTYMHPPQPPPGGE